MRRDNCDVIQGSKVAAISDQCDRKSVLDTSSDYCFEKHPLRVHTPLKRKSENVTKSEQMGGSDTQKICDFITSVATRKKYKKIRVNLELIDSE